MRQIYLIRHGETEWTLSGQYTGTTDLSLTERGTQQAALLRQRLKKIPFDQIFSSPRIRALESSEGLNPIIDANIAEWNYGDYEGLTSKQIHQKDPNWNLFRDGAPNGESVQNVVKRADQFLKTINLYKGKVAVFSHGHFLRVLTARYLGLEPIMGELFVLSVASLGILGREKDRNVVVLWNDTSHLEK
jgi:broad specificity phosphatase PhoE